MSETSRCISTKRGDNVLISESVSIMFCNNQKKADFGHSKDRMQNKRKQKSRNHSYDDIDNSSEKMSISEEFRSELFRNICADPCIKYRGVEGTPECVIIISFSNVNNDNCAMNKTICEVMNMPKCVSFISDLCGGRYCILYDQIKGLISYKMNRPAGVCRASCLRIVDQCTDFKHMDIKIMESCLSNEDDILHKATPESYGLSRNATVIIEEFVSDFSDGSFIDFIFALLEEYFPRDSVGSMFVVYRHCNLYFIAGKAANILNISNRCVFDIFSPQIIKFIVEAISVLKYEMKLKFKTSNTPFWHIMQKSCDTVTIINDKFSTFGNQVNVMESAHFIDLFMLLKQIDNILDIVPFKDGSIVCLLVTVLDYIARDLGRFSNLLSYDFILYKVILDESYSFFVERLENLLLWTSSIYSLPNKSHNYDYVALYALYMYENNKIVINHKVLDVLIRQLMEIGYIVFDIIDRICCGLGRTTHFANSVVPRYTELSSVKMVNSSSGSCRNAIIHSFPRYYLLILDYLLSNGVTISDMRNCCSTEFALFNFSNMENDNHVHSHIIYIIILSHILHQRMKEGSIVSQVKLFERENMILVTSICMFLESLAFTVFFSIFYQKRDVLVNDSIYKRLNIKCMIFRVLEFVYWNIMLQQRALFTHAINMLSQSDIRTEGLPFYYELVKKYGYGEWGKIHDSTHMSKGNIDNVKFMCNAVLFFLLSNVSSEETSGNSSPGSILWFVLNSKSYPDDILSYSIRYCNDHVLMNPLCFSSLGDESKFVVETSKEFLSVLEWLENIWILRAYLSYFPQNYLPMRWIYCNDDFFSEPQYFFNVINAYLSGYFSDWEEMVHRIQINISADVLKSHFVAIYKAVKYEVLNVCLRSTDRDDAADLLNNYYMRPIKLRLSKGPFLFGWTQELVDIVISTAMEFGIPIRSDGSYDFIEFHSLTGILSKTTVQIQELVQRIVSTFSGVRGQNDDIVFVRLPSSEEDSTFLAQFVRQFNYCFGSISACSNLSYKDLSAIAFLSDDSLSGPWDRRMDLELLRGVSQYGLSNVEKLCNVVIRDASCTFLFPTMTRPLCMRPCCGLRNRLNKIISFNTSVTHHRNFLMSLNMRRFSMKPKVCSNTRSLLHTSAAVLAFGDVQMFEVDSIASYDSDSADMYGDFISFDSDPLSDHVVRETMASGNVFSDSYGDSRCSSIISDVNSLFEEDDHEESVVDENDTISYKEPQEITRNRVKISIDDSKVICMSGYGPNSQGNSASGGGQQASYGSHTHHTNYSTMNQVMQQQSLPQPIIGGVNHSSMPSAAPYMMPNPISGMHNKDSYKGLQKGDNDFGIDSYNRPKRNDMIGIGQGSEGSGFFQSPSFSNDMNDFDVSSHTSISGDILSPRSADIGSYPSSSSMGLNAYGGVMMGPGGSLMSGGDSSSHGLYPSSSNHMNSPYDRIQSSVPGIGSSMDGGYSPGGSGHANSIFMTQGNEYKDHRYGVPDASLSGNNSGSSGSVGMSVGRSSLMSSSGMGSRKDDSSNGYMGAISSTISNEHGMGGSSSMKSSYSTGGVMHRTSYETNNLMTPRNGLGSGGEITSGSRLDSSSGLMSGTDLVSNSELSNSGLSNDSGLSLSNTRLESGSSLSSGPGMGSGLSSSSGLVSGLSSSSGLGSGLSSGPGMGSGLSSSSGLGNGLSSSSGLGNGLSSSSGVGSGLSSSSGLGSGLSSGPGMGSGLSSSSGLGNGLSSSSGMGSGLGSSSGMGSGLGSSSGMGSGLGSSSGLGSGLGSSTLPGNLISDGTDSMHISSYQVPGSSSSSVYGPSPFERLQSQSSGSSNSVLSSSGSPLGDSNPPAPSGLTINFLGRQSYSSLEPAMMDSSNDSALSGKDFSRLQQVPGMANEFVYPNSYGNDKYASQHSSHSSSSSNQRQSDFGFSSTKSSSYTGSSSTSSGIQSSHFQSQPNQGHNMHVTPSQKMSNEPPYSIGHQSAHTSNHDYPNIGPHHYSMGSSPKQSGISHMSTSSRLDDSHYYTDSQQGIQGFAAPFSYMPMSGQYHYSRNQSNVQVKSKPKSTVHKDEKSSIKRKTKVDDLPLVDYQIPKRKIAGPLFSLPEIPKRYIFIP